MTLGRPFVAICLCGLLCPANALNLAAMDRDLVAPADKRITELKRDLPKVGAPVEPPLGARLALGMVKAVNPPLGTLVGRLLDGKPDSADFFRLSGEALKHAASAHIGVLPGHTDVLKFFADKVGHAPQRQDMEKFILLFAQLAEQAKQPPALTELIKESASFASFIAKATPKEYDLTGHMVNFLRQTAALQRDLHAPAALPSFYDHAGELLKQGVPPLEILLKRSVPMIAETLGNMSMPQTSKLLKVALAQSPNSAVGPNLARLLAAGLPAAGDITKESVHFNEVMADMFKEFSEYHHGKTA